MDFRGLFWEHRQHSTGSGRMPRTWRCFWHISPPLCGTQGVGGAKRVVWCLKFNVVTQGVESNRSQAMMLPHPPCCECARARVFVREIQLEREHESVWERDTETDLKTLCASVHVHEHLRVSSHTRYLSDDSLPCLAIDMVSRGGAPSFKCGSTC